MSNTTPSWDTLIRAAIRVQLRGVRVALPGTVTSYDASTCQADVQPALLEERITEFGPIAERLPTIPHVPVIFCGGGGSRLTFPVAVGDTCWIMFSSSSLAKWKALGGEVDPEDDRHHNINDAVALVGLSDLAHADAASATATVLEGSDIRLGDQNANDAVLTAKDSTDFMAALDAAIVALGGPGVPSAQLDALKTALETLPLGAPHAGSPWGIGADTTKAK